MQSNGSSLSAANRIVAAYIATVIISPCAKFTTRTTPKMTDRPRAIRPYTRTVRTPAITTFATRSNDNYAFLYPSIGKTGFAVAEDAGRTTADVSSRFCTEAYQMR